MKFVVNKKLLLIGVIGYLTATAVGIYLALNDEKAEKEVNEKIDKAFKELERQETQETDRHLNEIKKLTDKAMKEMNELSNKDYLTNSDVEKARRIYERHLKDVEEYNKHVDEKYKIDISKLN